MTTINYRADRHNRSIMAHTRTTIQLTRFSEVAQTQVFLVCLACHFAHIYADSFLAHINPYNPYTNHVLQRPRRPSSAILPTRYIII